jgi:hypothetical protein
VESLKQTQLVADASSGHAKRAAEIAEHLADQSVQFVAIDVIHNQLSFQCLQFGRNFDQPDQPSSVLVGLSVSIEVGMPGLLPPRPEFGGVRQPVTDL